MAQRSMPDFLGIGGTRCGTTWLHDNLSRHPALWLPPVKELHYFDRSPRYASPSHLADDRLSQRLFAGERPAREWRREARRDVSRAPRHPSTLPWKLRYYLGKPTDAWYASLFPPPDTGLVRGEITPSYCLLGDPDVRRIHRLMPEARILFLIRDPVERAWSGFRRKGLSEEQIRSRLAQPTVDRRTDYLATLATWESHYPRERVYVGFFDDITEAPARLLTDVFEFLGVDSAASHVPATVTDRVNAAPAVPMPAEVRVALSRKHLALATGLSDRFGGHATRWLREAERSLSAASR